MTVNAGKCATIAIVVNGKSRKWVVDPRRFLKIGDSPELVKALSVADTYKYLGIQASASGATSCAEGKLERLLRQISRAPLKPQQRLWILNTRVFPSLRHDLVFCRTGKGFLRHLDRKVKTAVKGWLKLPKDTSDPSFWASVSDGGLGILSLEHCVPEWKRSRLTCMQFATNDPIMIELLAGNWLRKEIRMWSKPVTWRAHVMNCAETRSEAYRTELYWTIDGRGLKSAVFCEQPNPEPLVCATDFSVKWCPPPAVPSATWHTPHILALRGERAYAHSSPSHWRFLLLKLTSSIPMHPATGGVSNPGPLGWHTRTIAFTLQTVWQKVAPNRSQS